MLCNTNPYDQQPAQSPERQLLNRTTLLLPSNAALSEDGFAAAGRFLGRLWRFLQPWRYRPSER